MAAALMTVCAPALRAGDVSLVASVDKDKVTMDDRIVLTITVTGVQNPRAPQLPKIDRFAIASSGTSSQFNIVNGAMFASKSFNYVLMPEAPGTYTIKPATYTHEGTEYQTKPIQIEVLASGQAPARAQDKQKELELGDRIFVEVKVDKEEAYINEQVTMTFRLYRADLALDDLQYAPPVTKNFVEEAVGKQRNYREVVNGVVYDIIELKTALFPVSSGEVEISPAKLKCSILVRSQRRRTKRESPFGDLFGDSFFDDPFFDRYVKYPIELQSKPLKIRVKPLPEQGCPAEFKGAVGEFSMDVSVKPARVKAGEPITLTMRVYGEGNISGVNPPEIPGLKDFKAYEPESKVNLSQAGEQIRGEKIFERILVPERPGRQEIPRVVFPYFDTKTRRYISVERGPFAVEIDPAPPGSVMQSFDRSESVAGKKEVRILKQDILFIKTSPGMVTRADRRLIGSPLFLTVQLIPLVLFIGIFVFIRREERFRTDVRFARQTRAYKLALKGLSDARKVMKDGQEKEFYSKVTRALCDYIGNKLNVPGGGITPLAITEILEPKGIDPGLIASVRKVLETCDMGQFALSRSDAGGMAELLREADGVVKKLERAL